MSLTNEEKKIMYSTKLVEDDKKIIQKSIKASTSRTLILLELDGKKHQIPTYKAYNDLLIEFNNTKTKIREVLYEVKSLKAVILSLNSDVRYMEDELRGKVDRIDR